jgi:hypothetical protein
MRIEYLAIAAAAVLLSVGSASAAKKHPPKPATDAYAMSAPAAATSTANAPKSVIWSPSPKATNGWSTEVPPQYALEGN